MNITIKIAFILTLISPIYSQSITLAPNKESIKDLRFVTAAQLRSTAYMRAYDSWRIYQMEKFKVSKSNIAIRAWGIYRNGASTRLTYLFIPKDCKDPHVDSEEGIDFTCDDLYKPKPSKIK